MMGNPFENKPAYESPEHLDKDEKIGFDMIEECVQFFEGLGYDKMVDHLRLCQGMLLIKDDFENEDKDYQKGLH